MLMLLKVGFIVCLDQMTDALTQPLAMGHRVAATILLWTFTIHEFLG